MAIWSKYPDGSDYNIDTFAAFVERYFVKCINPKLEFNYDDEPDFDPGLTVRMDLRLGGSPKFSEEDTSDKAMDYYLELFTMYSKHIEARHVVGFAISLCRLINNEKFGLGVDVLPEQNPLRNDITIFINGLIKQMEDEEIIDDLKEFFKPVKETPVIEV